MQIINWGLIGCGDIAAKRVAPAMRDPAGTRNPGGGAQGRLTSLVLEAAYRSSREGVAVKIEQP